MEEQRLEGKLPKSLNLLEELKTDLSCVTCNKLNKEIFMLNCCLAKYCKECVETVRGNPCVSCDQKGLPADIRKDYYSSSVAELILNFNESFVAGELGIDNFLSGGGEVLMKIKALGGKCTLKRLMAWEGDGPKPIVGNEHVEVNDERNPEGSGSPTAADSSDEKENANPIDLKPKGFIDEIEEEVSMSESSLEDYQSDSSDGKPHPLRNAIEPLTDYGPSDENSRDANKELIFLDLDTKTLVSPVKTYSDYNKPNGPAPREAAIKQGEVLSKAISSDEEVSQIFEKSPVCVPASPEIFVETPPKPLRKIRPFSSNVLARMSEKRMRSASSDSGDERNTPLKKKLTECDVEERRLSTKNLSDTFVAVERNADVIEDDEVDLYRGHATPPILMSEQEQQRATPRSVIQLASTSKGPQGSTSKLDLSSAERYRQVSVLSYVQAKSAALASVCNSKSPYSSDEELIDEDKSVIPELSQYSLTNSGNNFERELSPDGTSVNKPSSSKSNKRKPRSRGTSKKQNADAALLSNLFSDEEQPPELTPQVPSSSSSGASTSSKRNAKAVLEELLDLGTGAQRELREIELHQHASPAPDVTEAANLSTSFSSGKEKRNAKGETALHIACRTGNVQKVQELLDKGADFSSTDHAGWTPLHDTISGKGTDVAKGAIVQLLCQRGCNVNAMGGIEEDTPLHEAAMGGQERIVEILLSFGAVPTIRNNDGKLPRDVAFNDFIIKLLDNRAKSNGLSLNPTNVAYLALDDPSLHQIRSEKAQFYFNFEISDRVLHEVVYRLKLRVVDTFSDKVTHIVYDTDSENEDDRLVPFGWEYLVGLAKGLWQLSYHWICKSLYHSRCLPLSDFEISGCKEPTEDEFNYFENYSFSGTTGIPGLARVNREKGNPGLFDGFTFYLYKRCGFPKLTKKSIFYLAILAGAKISNREPDPETLDPLDHPSRFHTLQDSSHKFTLTSHVILFCDLEKPPDFKIYNMEHVKTLNLNWLIESLGHFQLLVPEAYL